MCPGPVKFTPIPKERIWGGHILKEMFRYEGTEPIGEYWVLSGHPNGISIVAEGEFKGKTLDELIRQYPDDYLGKSPQKRFPLLIKFLDTAEDLSVQVHPDNSYAKKHEGDFGKTESWYILNTKKGNQIIYGHHFQNKKEYLNAIKEKNIKPYLKYIPIHPNQHILIPSGTLHAIRSNTVLIEIQQTSDITYRVYDWDRVDQTGQLRDLHIEKAADVLDYSDSENHSIQHPYSIYTSNTIQHIRHIKCPYFTVDEIKIQKNKYHLDLGEIGNPDILVIAEGNGSLYYEKEKKPIPLHAGDVLLIPSCIMQYELQSNEHLTLLRTFY